MHMKVLILVGHVAYAKSLTFVLPAFSNHSLHHVYDRKTGVCVGACAATYALNIQHIVHTAMHISRTPLGLIAGAEWIFNEIHELINCATIIAVAQSSLATFTSVLRLASARVVCDTSCVKEGMLRRLACKADWINARESVLLNSSQQILRCSCVDQTASQHTTRKSIM